LYKTYKIITVFLQTTSVSEVKEDLPVVPRYRSTVTHATEEQKAMLQAASSIQGKKVRGQI